MYEYVYGKLANYFVEIELYSTTQKAHLRIKAVGTSRHVFKRQIEEGLNILFRTSFLFTSVHDISFSFLK